MPTIQITLIAGRTVEQKRKVAQRVTQVMVEECGVPADAVIVAFHEVDRDSYARGGVLMSERAK